MSSAIIRSISGPVLRATVKGPFRTGEAIEVGAQKLRGEVIRLKGDTFVAQVYEDTTGLRPGDPIEGTGRALSARLGPNLLGRIFDGLMRPLDIGGEGTDAGKRSVRFRPLVKLGQHVKGGAIAGAIENSSIPQYCLVPPELEGVVESIISEGEYPEGRIVGSVRRSTGALVEFGFIQLWPVRLPRPVAERLPADEPLVTGQKSLTPFSQLHEAAGQHCREGLAQARPFCRNRLPKAATPTSLFMSAAASGATRWLRCCTSFPS